MAPIGPLKFKRTPEPVRRHIDVAAATGWEALVEAHAAHALRFVALLANRSPIDQAMDRYLGEMDVRDPMASSIRSRVLIALEHARAEEEGRPSLQEMGGEDAGVGAAEAGGDGIKRFRPDVLVKGIARKARAAEEVESWIRLAIARAEEGIIRAHIDNAVTFAGILHGHLSLDEAVEDYIELMRVSGGRAQAVYQRTMARLADAHLPDPDDGPSGAVATGRSSNTAEPPSPGS